jgi:hypothetical protein
MFLALVFIVLGLFLLLNAMGIIVGANFWGLFWAIVFLAIGIKMLIRQGRCPICAGYWWSGKIHEKIHDHCCDHDHKGKEHDHE